MKQKTVQITGASIGEGQERICHVHPDDANEMIKLQKGAINRQTLRRERFFEQLKIHSAEMIETCGSIPKTIVANYRKRLG